MTIAALPIFLTFAAMIALAIWLDADRRLETNSHDARARSVRKLTRLAEQMSAALECGDIATYDQLAAAHRDARGPRVRQTVRPDLAA